MVQIKLFGIAIVVLATTGTMVSGQEDENKMPIETLIGDLGSTDGGKRTAATSEIFLRGKAVLPELKKAGAKQVAPTFEGVGGIRRLDVVYSILEGLPPNQPNALAGYITNSFGLHVEKDTTEEEFQKLCKLHGCTPLGKFDATSNSGCYVQIDQGKSLEGTIRQILSTETKVTTINLNYFDR